MDLIKHFSSTEVERRATFKESENVEGAFSGVPLKHELSDGRFPTVSE